MVRTSSIIACIASFVAGVFVTNLSVTYHLNANDVVVTNSLDKSGLVRGSTNQNCNGDAPQNVSRKGITADDKAKLMKEIADLKRTIDRLQITSDQSRSKNDNADLDIMKDKQSGICSLLPHPTPSALSIWSNHLPKILNATQHPEDEHFAYREFTSLLLHIMTPDRIQRGVKTLPLDWTPVERGLDVMYKRWKFIQDKVNAYRAKSNLTSNAPIPPNVLHDIHKDEKIPRPLHVLVMGGSVTMGVVCHINPVKQTGIARRNCAWSGRMTSFLSILLGGYELVQFHNVALGGTNTESGTIMWDYSLLSGDKPYPDVVINAYATNDMHYNSVQTALAKNITLEHSLIQLNQAFVRQVLTPKRECGHSPPLLLYFDDYLGNEQNEVLTTMISTQTIHLLSNYYGLGSISYADTVRDIVYGDSKEWWYHSNWFEKGAYERAVHPNMGMHITATWIVGFYFINMVTTYCSLPSHDLSDGTPDKESHDNLHAGLGLPLETKLKGWPKQRPRGLPPMLTEDLSLEHISDIWFNDTKATNNLWKNSTECVAESKVINDAEPIEKPCMYSWVVGLERFLDKSEALTNKIKPQMIFNEGWSAANDNNKLGWVPSDKGSKFAMEWKSVTQPIRSYTLMIMRSYGDKWEGSKLKVEIWSKNKLMASDEIVGFHNKKTSETYNVKMKIGDVRFSSHEQTDVMTSKEIPIGSDLKIIFELVGGNTFKILGMAICDH